MLTPGGLSFRSARQNRRQMLAHQRARVRSGLLWPATRPAIDAAAQVPGVGPSPGPVRILRG